MRRERALATITIALELTELGLKSNISLPAC
jgi:hypothetical protein